MAHIAIWVQDLEKMKAFYMAWFGANPEPIYHNPAKKFTSCFLSFENSTRLELMHQEGHTDFGNNGNKTIGLAHIAISVGNKELVNRLTKAIKKMGFEVIGEPRTTGDGYYESVIRDPEGNLIEITI